MSTRIEENLEVSDRYVRIHQDDRPSAAANVYLIMPCEHAHNGKHVLGFDREEFYRAVQSELGLKDPLEELYALSSEAIARK